MAKTRLSRARATSRDKQRRNVVPATNFMHFEEQILSRFL